VSRSKKPNKEDTPKKTKSPQATNQSSAGPLRVEAKRTEQTLLTQAVQPQAYNKLKSSKFLTNVLRILALFVVVGITVYIYSIRERVGEFKEWGYGGIFLIALLANATVLLPAPGVAVIYAMGAIFNPLGVGLAAGTGGTLGELSGYLAGFSGQAVVERTEVYARIRPWVDKYGGWTILVLSAIPNPFFDVAGIAAGVAKMPVHTFLIFTGIGQLIKMTLFAVAGHYSVTFISNLMP
jgi:membrane protein DedA with SNARE-associated domain